MPSTVNPPESMPPVHKNPCPLSSMMLRSFVLVTFPLSLSLGLMQLICTWRQVAPDHTYVGGTCTGCHVLATITLPLDCSQHNTSVSKCRKPRTTHRHLLGSGEIESAKGCLSSYRTDILPLCANDCGRYTARHLRMPAIISYDSVAPHQLYLDHGFAIYCTTSVHTPWTSVPTP